MAFRFHRSLKLFPGVRLNISKRGLGISAGVRGLHVGLDSRGKRYTSAGIPGTGLSVRTYAKGAPPANRARANGAAIGALVGCGLVLFVLLLVVLAILR